MPEFREAFGREILSYDLISLLRRFDVYASETNGNISALTLSVVELTKNMAEMNRNIDEIRRSHDRDHDVLRWFIDNKVIKATRNNDINIASLFADVRGINRFRLRRLTQEECDDLLDNNLDAIDALGTEGKIWQTFGACDIIVEASQRRSRDTIFYIAIEASYMVNADDVIRATDHAKILRGVTGHETFAVVSGVEVNPDIGEAYRQRIICDLTKYMESEQDDVVYWFNLTDGILEPPQPYSEMLNGRDSCAVNGTR